MIIHIIGVGHMGGAIAKTLAQNYKVFVFNRRPTKIMGAIFDARLAFLPKADYVIIAVKPQDMPALARQIQGLVKESAVMISIAAGVKISKIQRIFHHRKVVRVMPNLGLLVGQGIAGWFASGLSDLDRRLAKKILNGICENFEVNKQSDIDAITAISGSGPAYFFYFADALKQAALKLGLSANVAGRLVEKTFSASALLQGQGDYQALIKKVRSKKGTTDAALKVFNRYRLGKIIKVGVKAGLKRAQELSNG